MRRFTTLVLVIATLLGLAGPIGAQSLSEARQQREATRKQRAQVAAQLDVLKASDREVEAALADLEANYRTLTAKATAARQAHAAAENELAATRAELEDTRARIQSLHELVVDRAVEAYVRPRAALLDQLVSGGDLTDAAHRQVLLEQVAANDLDVLDQLREAKQDLEILEREVAEIERVAAERKAESERVAAEARAARDEQARVKAALDARIAEVTAHAGELAKQESSLAALIKQKEAELGGFGPPSASGLIWPVRGSVTSEYGPRWGRMHAGIDIAAPTGTPIWAAKDGLVIYAGSMSGYGNVVVLDHGGGFSTVYAHQSAIGVGEGQRVDQGQVIGRVGSTGRSTGPHLHFETRVNNSAQNPRRYL